MAESKRSWLPSLVQQTCPRTWLGFLDSFISTHSISPSSEFIHSASYRFSLAEPYSAWIACLYECSTSKRVTSGSGVAITGLSGRTTDGSWVDHWVKQKYGFPHMICGISAKWTPNLRWCCEWFVKTTRLNSLYWFQSCWKLPHIYKLKETFHCCHKHSHNQNESQKQHHNHTAKTTTITKKYHLTLKCILDRDKKAISLYTKFLRSNSQLSRRDAD